ncbi:MAG: site-2 protease family protein [Thermostichales cyanobacterium HHBFW_bins_127]
MSLTAELTPLFLVGGLVLLGWSLNRARQRGMVGILGWLQSLTLFLPWLIFIALLSAGIYLSIVGFVILLAVSTVIYIALGQALRQRLLTELQHRPPNPPPQETTPGIPEAQDWGRSQVTDEDLAAIRSIFGLDTFFATEIIPYASGVIVKGNLRGDADPVLAALTEKMEAARPGQWRVYLVEDGEEKPTVLLLPERLVNRPVSQGVKYLAVGLLVATLLTLLEVGANLAGFDLLTTPERWPEALPIAAGIFATLVVHETGHRWMAGKYGVRLGPALTIPALGIGTLGTLTGIESPVPHRRALFDIAFAGPAAGGIFSLGVLIAGLVLSKGSGLIYVPSAVFQNSVLVGSLAKWILGPELSQEVIGIHPFVAIGWIGLAVTALSLLPAGQLDGGRMIQAVYGRKTAARATLITLILLGIAALGNAIALYWALLILLVAREPERPPLNELSETDTPQDALALLALFLTIMTLLPVTPVLARFLNFGGVT